MSGVVLNRALTLETPVRIGDGAGGFNEVWQALGTLWASVNPRVGRLASNADAGSVSVAAFQVIVRAVPEGHSGRPRPGQRFRLGGRVFVIAAVTEDEPSARYLLCECREEVVS